MSRGRTPVAEDVVEAVVRMYVEDGATLKAIGAAFGKTRTWTWHIIRKRVPRGRQRLQRVTDEVRNRVVQAYQAGATVTQAAEAGGCSMFTAWTHLKRLGLLRPTQIDAADLVVIGERYKAGLTPYEIAGELNLGLGTVLKAVYSQRL